MSNTVKALPSDPGTKMGELTPLEAREAFVEVLAFDPGPRACINTDMER